jgi:hypothetical protein
MTSRVIFKYTLPEPGETDTFTTPRGPLVHVGYDGAGRGCFWVHGETDQEIERTVTVVGTGWRLDGGWSHRGTLVDSANGFVWHVLEGFLR